MFYIRPPERRLTIEEAFGVPEMTLLDADGQPWTALTAAAAATAQGVRSVSFRHNILAAHFATAFSDNAAALTYLRRSLLEAYGINPDAPYEVGYQSSTDRYWVRQAP
jgi:hypothetical protein